ncbi:MAG TPA: DNA ligase D [Candidatus Saccharimonadales bacterium]|nr:DNA ligase D [Candidatus Saccharimonadales bacterium]
MASLGEYRKKRPRGKSPEPRGGKPSPDQNSFVVQRHDATRLHYDFRLEMDGVLKSWAVPKGPSLNPSDKRLAVQTEDHPLDYGGFEGTIPEGNYGAGEVILWDSGTYDLEGGTPGPEQIRKGELKFTLHGEKLNGSFVLVKLRNSRKQNEWLLIKHKDNFVHADWEIADHDRSIKTGKPPGPPRHPHRTNSSGAAPASARNLTNAARASIPEQFQPALASLADKPFSSDDWIYEIKWDGIRALAVVKDGTTELIARSGRRITAEYPELSTLARNVRVRQAVLDGEIVVLDEKGRSDFQRLQSRFGVVHPSVKLQSDSPPTFYLFDVLYCDGYDVRRAPLVERKELLRKIIAVNEQVRVSEHQVGNGIALFDVAIRSGLEGLIAKRLDGPYPAGRTSSWLKFKPVREVDAVIGGWTDPRGSRAYFGSLLLGLYDKAALRFIGGVGTGFPQALEKELFERLQKIALNRSPFSPVPRTREQAHWVEPELVARVGYAEWTSDDQLRQPRFLGIQPDRDARDSTLSKEKAPPVAERTSAKETPKTKEQAPAAGHSPKSSSAIAALIEKDQQEQLRFEVNGRHLTLTHLNKVYFPQAEFTKRDVLSYYARVSPFVLPFLKDRPLVLHRYPNGISGNAFYQKEAGESIPDWIQTVEIFSETKRHNVDYFLINDLASLLYLTNLGCIEHNPFSARSDDLEKPDYMFVDLDPTEGTDFSRVVRAAQAVGKVLVRARLKFFTKTSGATGLHLFVPISRRYGFDHVRAFLEIVARMAMDQEAELLTRTHRVQDRPKNTVFVDVRQNSYGQSLASVFSLRPREGAPVSTPLAWNELSSRLRPAQWTLRSVLADLPRRAKLWAPFFDYSQTLEAAVAALEKSERPPGPTKPAGKRR